ncbi:MAG: RDD family protein [bacterium]|nr:RDD family protein [bacterium]
MNNLETKRSPQLIVLTIVDLEGFTNFSSNLSADELSNFLENFKSLIQTNAESNNGKLIKFLGDGAIVVFNTIDKSINFSRKIIDYYRETQTKAKIFVTVGEVFFDDNDVFGHDVNFAFRMLETLKGGALAISESTYHILKDKNGFLPTKELSVKGVGDGIKIFVYGDPERFVSETDDVRFYVKPAGLWERFIAFYLDVIVFVSSVGLITTFAFRGLFGHDKNEVLQKIDASQESEIAKIEGEEITKSGDVAESGAVEKREVNDPEKKIPQEDIKLFEFETPLGKIKAGRGELEIETQGGEIYTEPGKVEIKIGEEKKFSISYLYLSGIEIFMFAIYLSLSWFFFKGRTLGEWIMKIRVERLDRSPPDIRISFLRAILLIFMVLPAGLGIIIPLLISRGKSLLHDTITKTMVVRD